MHLKNISNELKGIFTCHYTWFVLMPISLGSFLILSSRLRLGLPKVPFPVDLPVKILKAVFPF